MKNWLYLATILSVISILIQFYKLISLKSKKLIFFNLIFIIINNYIKNELFTIQIIKI